MDAISYDSESGIITMAGGSGQLTAEDVSNRRKAIASLVAKAKTDRGRARLLHVGDDLPVQNQEIAKMVTERMKDGILNGPDDRFALVARSTLARLQFTRIAGDDNRKAFATEAEARAWLASD